MPEYGEVTRLTGLTGAHWRPPEVPRCPTCGSDRPEVHQYVKAYVERPDGRSGEDRVVCADDWHPVTSDEVGALRDLIAQSWMDNMARYRALPGTNHGALELARTLIRLGVRPAPDEPERPDA